MDMDGISHNSTGPAAAVVQSRKVAVVEVKTQTTETEIIEEDKRLIDEIREKGFSKFLEELEEKKKEELREKILRSMGLSEEDLENMPAEQRAQIEDMITRKMVERMATNSHMNGSTTAIMFQQTEMSVQYSEIDVSANIASNMGLGPLLALQESEAVEAQTAQGKERKEELLTG
ncbi:hypothetical protein V5T82_15650 [Magnetovibrio sp. PR-2]|uniref:hypothetical protein n=1 Tax=Magnetovibrio sp. PR-2 TaxID=3120356 RepID=UPI002FCE3702